MDACMDGCMDAWMDMEGREWYRKL